MPFFFSSQTDASFSFFSLFFSFPKNRSNAGDAEDEDVSSELSRWREAAAALEREARQAAGASSAASKSVAAGDETSASSTSSSSFDLDALSARLSELERQAAVLATKVGRSREGETLLSCAASAREALRRARASATPAFSLAAVASASASAAVAGVLLPKREEEEEEKKRQKEKEDAKQQEEAKEAEATASRVADGAPDAARLSDT